MSAIERVLQAFGAVAVASISVKFLSNLRLFLTPSSFSLNRWNHGSPYVLVTGATDGIGFGFVEAFAARGFNVVLLARNKAKLEDRRTTLQKQYPNLKFEILVFDVLNDEYGGIEKLVASVSHLNITILVNNVGGIPFVPGYRLLTEYDASQIDNTIDMNTRFMAHFTRYMIPVLSTNGPALVLNIGSGARHGIPSATVYSGTKGFVLSFSESLARECKINGIPIDVLNINLADVSTKQTPTPVHLGNPTAREFSNAAVGRVGAAVAAGYNTVTPYIPHAILFSILSSLPEFLAVQLLGNMIRDAQKLHKEIFKMD